MMRRLSGFIVICLLLSACDRSSDPPVVQILGTERLGWDQKAASAEVLATIRFAVFVDDVRSDMEEVVCESTEGVNGFPCSGRLPRMAAGRHTLEMMSIGGDGAPGESGRSEPLIVVLMTSASLMQSIGAVSPQDLLAPPASTITADRVRLNISQVATGLTDPTDLAFLPDGRLLVAERRGSIRVVRLDPPAGQLPEPAVMLDDVETRAEGGLLSIAPDPQFDRNGYVYALYTSARGFRLARFREAGGVLADSVILLDGINASRLPPAAVVRFGLDAKLYLGVDDGGDPRRAGDLGSYNGKLLRFNADATTPSDQAGGTPVFALDVNAPRGLDWGESADSIWIAQHGASRSGPGELRALVRAPRGRPERPRIATRYLLPEGTPPSQIVMYRGTLIPEFRGNLLMPAGSRGGLLRLKFDPADSMKVVSSERLFDGATTDVRAIAVGTNGAIYVSTSTTLLRIAP